MSAVHRIDHVPAPSRAKPTPSARRPFSPREGQGPYRLPHDIRDRLTAALADYRNREAAYALAVFLARFWSARSRLARPFPVDRRALANHPRLGLTEARVRGALRVLEEVGFLNRGEPLSGSAYKPTPDGLHRKPITFGFGAEYGPAFAAANARVHAARQRQEGGRRTLEPSAARKPVLALSVAFSNSPKIKASRGSVVLMGEVAKATGMQRVASRPEPHPELEAALANLGSKVGVSLPVRIFDEDAVRI